jgi:hypothetical protein
MNLFKQTLVASAIVTACGAVNAADLTQPDVTFSKEGVALIDTNTQATLTTVAGTYTGTRIIVREVMDASDEISLTFSKGVDLTNATPVVFGSPAAAPAAGQFAVDYGTGTFELEQVSVTTVSATGITTVKLKVKTGSTLNANDSFEIKLDAISLPASGVATVNYSAVSGITGLAKDTTGNNSALLIRQQSQYGASVSKVLDGLIEREEQVSFIENGDFYKSSVSYLDSFEVIITDDQNLELAVAAAVSRITVTGILLMIRHQLH